MCEKKIIFNKINPLLTKNLELQNNLRKIRKFIFKVLNT